LEFAICALILEIVPVGGAAVPVVVVENADAPPINMKITSSAVRVNKDEDILVMNDIHHTMRRNNLATAVDRLNLTIFLIKVASF